MYLGIGTYTYPWSVGIHGYQYAKNLTATGLLHIAATKKISYVQFGDNMPLHEFSQEQLLTLKQSADELNIHLEVGTRGLVADKVRNYIEIAAALGSPFVRVVIDDNDYEPGLAEIIETIKNTVPFLRKQGIRLAIENHDRFPAATLERIILLTDPEWVGICMDTANSLGAGEGIMEIVSVLAPYTLNLHIKDVTIKRVNHKMGFTVEGTTAGKGQLNIPWITDQVASFGKCNTAMLEHWINPEATVDETLIKEREMADKSIEYLKTFLL